MIKSISKFFGANSIKSEIALWLSFIPTLLIIGALVYLTCSEKIDNALNTYTIEAKFALGLIVLFLIIFLFSLGRICFYKKNPRVVFDRIISRGKFRSSILLVVFFITTLFLASYLILNAGKCVSPNELVEYDQKQTNVSLFAKQDPDSLIIKLNNYRQLTSFQKDSIDQLIKSYIAHRDTPSGSLPICEKAMETYAHNDTVQISSGDSPGLLWSIYYHIIDPGNQHMAKTPLARFIAVLLSLFGTVFLGGLFISILTNIFDTRRERWVKGSLRYNCLKNHYVIIGCNEMVPNIVNQIFNSHRTIPTNTHSKYRFLDERLPYIIILTSGNVETLRDELESELDRNEQKRVIFYYGNRGSAEDINGLNLHKAKEIYVLGESVDKSCDGLITQGESYHDTLNMTCVMHIATFLNKKAPNTTPKKCHILFEYQTTFSVFQFAQLPQQEYKSIEFLPFNYYESWAQKVLINNRVALSRNDSNSENHIHITYTPLDGNGIGADDEKFVHLIIVGMSKMGIALALEAAHICHFPNFRTHRMRTRITFIDSRAKNEADFFMGRYKEMFKVARWRYVNAGDYASESKYPDNVRPGIYSGGWCDPLYDTESNSPYKYLAEPPQANKCRKESFLDIEWEFIEGNLESPSIQNYLTDATKNPKAYSTIALCLTQTHQAIAAALYMPQDVYDKAQEILVYQRESPGIINIFKEQAGDNKGDDSNNKFRKLRPFGMLNCCYDIMTDNDTLNRAQHVNYVYSTDDFKLEKSDGNTISYWQGLSVEKKWSNIYNANSIETKLRSYNILGETTENQVKIISTNLDEMVEVEHNRWNIEKLLMGFRPLTEEESDNIRLGKETKRNLRDGRLKAHLDICSYKMLQQVDPDVCKYDVNITKSIPYIVAKTQTLR